MEYKKIVVYNEKEEIIEIKEYKGDTLVKATYMREDGKYVYQYFEKSEIKEIFNMIDGEWKCVYRFPPLKEKK